MHREETTEPPRIIAAATDGEKDMDQTSIIDVREDRAPNRSVEPYLAALRSDPCAYCGGSSGTHDHIVPRLTGRTYEQRQRGRDSWLNLTAACRACNASKGAKTLLAFLGYRDWMREHGEHLAELRAWTGVGA